MKITVKELVKFALFAALIYASKVAMAWIPNVHIIGPIIMALTITYKKKALYPIFGYVFIEGLMSGFAIWWIPYLYIWPLLWWITVDMPKFHLNLKNPAFYMGINAVHGFTFGTLYAAFYCPFMGMNLNEAITYIVAGLPFDAIHGVSNLFMGLLTIPLINLLDFCEHKMNYS